MKEYAVELTMIHNKTVHVQAPNSTDAIRRVRENLDEFAHEDSFTFGEITVDYADEVDY